MRVLIDLPPHLHDTTVCGLPPATLLSQMCETAGLQPCFDEARGQGPVLALDGRFLLLGGAALLEHIERVPGGGTLVDWERRPIAVYSPDGAPEDRAKGLLERSPEPHREPDAGHEPFPADDGWALVQLAASVQARLIAEHARAGVQFMAPDGVLIDATVQIASGARIWPGAVLRGATVIGAGAEIQTGAVLVDTRVDEGATIKPYTVAEQAHVGAGSAVGPMAHLRPGTRLDGDNKVGNFVEVKKATLARGAKASHLTYLGDAHIGEDANIGAGTITCNYDGWGKYTTTVGKGAFIGSNTALVAPISVGDGAIVGAGSILSADVPADALAVERGDTRVLQGYAPRMHARNKKKAGK